MPVHDWTRVGAGIFNHFHHSWGVALKRALNDGVLPRDYYALVEQVSGAYSPELISTEGQGDGFAPGWEGARVGVRHDTDDRLIAMIKVVSPGSKASRSAQQQFAEKAADALQRRFHLTVLDLLPPTVRDPQGMHGAIWEEFGGEAYQMPADKPLTLVGYDARPPCVAYIEPVAVGDVLPPMPLFLEPGVYVNVPLEATYQAAFLGVPQRWRRVLE